MQMILDDQTDQTDQISSGQGCKGKIEKKKKIRKIIIIKKIFNQGETRRIGFSLREIQLGKDENTETSGQGENKWGKERER